MFDALSDRIEGIFGRLRSRGRLDDETVEEILREVRLALLEADVHTAVVRTFVGKIRERAVGDEVRKALTPAQQVIKIVNEELIGILGEKHVPLHYSSKPPTVIMLAGLQGSGKTTTAGKLAKLLKARGKRPLLVACDLRRPAAIEQLQLLGEQVDVPVVARQGETDAVALAAFGLEEARRLMRDVVIVDTAGRLHIDEEMMAEAAAIRAAVQPDETLFVADAMTGQDAVNVATAFLERVDFTGMILTKLDGDARGGAALSVAQVTGRPIKFASTGEQLDAFEAFHPDRMASRILGMGDMLTLIEKAEEAFEDDERAEMQEKMRKATFTLEDFLKQMRQMRKMGSVSSLIGMLPGAKALKDMDIDEKEMRQVEAIIQAMTPAERNDPKLLNNSRRQRIARGCGRNVSDVNALVKQFEQAKVMMRVMAGGGGAANLPHGMMAGLQDQPRSGAGKGKPKNRPHRPKTHGKNKKKKRK